MASGLVGVFVPSNALSDRRQEAIAVAVNGSQRDALRKLSLLKRLSLGRAGLLAFVVCGNGPVTCSSTTRSDLKGLVAEDESSFVVWRRQSAGRSTPCVCCPLRR